MISTVQQPTFNLSLRSPYKKEPSLFCPAPSQDSPGAVVGEGVCHGAVEDPHVDEVEELREELDGERCVDAAAAQQSHGVGEDGQDLPGQHG